MTVCRYLTLSSPPSTTPIFTFQFGKRKSASGILSRTIWTAVVAHIWR
ncbi:hypothetical protein LINPERHAP2_LOCUS35039 [Linum perenne]